MRESLEHLAEADEDDKDIDTIPCQDYDMILMEIETKTLLYYKRQLILNKYFAFLCVRLRR